MERWRPTSGNQPQSEQEMGLAALRIAVGGFARFLVAAWEAGQRVIVESSLAALLNNAFTVEPAVEADSAAQEQQARSSNSSPTTWPRQFVSSSYQQQCTDCVECCCKRKEERMLGTCWSHKLCFNRHEAAEISSVYLSQAALLLLDELMALGANDEELAQLLFPMLMVRELRDATPPVKATAALVLGHFGSACAQVGNM